METDLLFGRNEKSVMNGVYACSLRSEVIKYYLLVLGSWFENKVG